MREDGLAGDRCGAPCRRRSNRAYLRSIPESYDPSTRTPLILNFHGLGSDKEQQALYTGMNRHGRRPRATWCSRPTAPVPSSGTGPFRRFPGRRSTSAS